MIYAEFSVQISAEKYGYVIREFYPKYLPTGPNFPALYNVALQSIADKMYIQ